MNPLLKWPGGKSGEINQIEKHVPTYDRYVEPFFGGGALFFHLNPKKAAINDISRLLTDFYKLIQNQDNELYELLLCYNNSFKSLMRVCDKIYADILSLYNRSASGDMDKKELEKRLSAMLTGLTDEMDFGISENLIMDEKAFIKKLCVMAADKIRRTVANSIKSPFSDQDLKNNLITGFTSGYYMYFRDIYNDINLDRIKSPSLQYKIANFCFIREYCYGSMFRYNKKGEFNIPYGGISYNKKNFKSKIDNMFNSDVRKIFMNTDIDCDDFEAFLNKANLTQNDFMFLDPPYDTDFSDYEGKDFTKHDHERLAHSLAKTAAQFILVIKNTEFIYSLYKDKFNILSFDNQYTYNVRSRNERKTEHLLITNIPV